MKTWIIIGAIFALALIAGIFVSAIGPSENQTLANSESCTANNCPHAQTGGCTAINNCGSATCGAANGGLCGCGR